MVAYFAEISYRFGNLAVYGRTVRIRLVAKVGQILYGIGNHPVKPIVSVARHINIVLRLVVRHRRRKVFVEQLIAENVYVYARFVIEIVGKIFYEFLAETAF